MTYRPQLDGIRAIAVVAVVLFHAGLPGCGGGFVGVDVFFVISGYLISGLLLEELHDTGDISVRAFIERRIRRLAPAMFVVLLATLLGSLLWLTPIGGEQQGVARSAVAAVLLSANHYFFAHSGGYFDAPRETFPLLHTWSLSVEEQFYLAWPWLLLLAARFGGGPRRGAWALLASVFCVSLLGCAWLTSVNHQMAFFLTPFRAWEFAAGGMAWLLVRHRPLDEGAGWLAWAGLALVLASIGWLKESMSFPGWIASVPVVGTAMLIVGVECAPRGAVARLLSLRPVVFVGLVSYSLYLWHWPLLSIATIVRDEPLTLSQGLALVALALLLSWLTWRFVEQPVRRRRLPIMATRRRTFAVGAALASSLLVSALAIGAWAQYVWPSDATHATMQRALLALDTPRLPNCVQPTPYSGRLVSAAPCSVPAGNHNPSVLFWGDSHAFHLQPLARELAESRGITARVRFMAGCPPLRGFGSGDPDRCADYNEDVLREIATLRRQGLASVVIAARWPLYFATPAASGESRKGLQRTLEALDSLGLRVIVVGPLPTLPHRARTCLLRRQARECGVARSEAEAFVGPLLAQLRRIVATEPRTRLFEPMPLICGKTRCEPIRGSEILFYDDNHLSAAGSRSLLPAFLPTLDWAIGGRPDADYRPHAGP